jgi:hypothetical protein
MNRTQLIINELKKTKGYKNYNGWRNNKTNFGYHSFNIDEISIKGQRNPKQRIKEFLNHVNFDNKIVVDIGCNVGGMLLHLENIKQGIGFDFDNNVIDAATNIASILGKSNLTFKNFDFDKSSILNFEKELSVTPDIVFLLSIAHWIKNWKEVYNYFISVNADIIFETNESASEKEQLEFFKSHGLTPLLIISGSPDECIKNKCVRNTYYVENKLLSKTDRSIVIKNNKSVLSKFYDIDNYLNIKNIYERIKTVKYVPEMKFNDRLCIIETPFLEKTLHSIKDASLEEKNNIKEQLIDLINQLYKIQVSHRDLHTNNIFWDKNQIWLIDWEYAIIDNTSSIETWYDLESSIHSPPNKNWRIDIFSDHEYSLKNFLLPEIILQKKDFN